MKHLLLVIPLLLTGCAYGELMKFERNRPMTNAEYEKMTRDNFTYVEEVEKRDPEFTKKVNQAIDNEKTVYGKMYQIDLKNMEVKEILFEVETE